MNIIEAPKGMSIYNAVEQAKKELNLKGYKDGKLQFNDLLVPLSIDSNSTDIAIIYNLMHELRSLRK